MYTIKIHIAFYIHRFEIALEHFLRFIPDPVQVVQVVLIVWLIQLTNLLTRVQTPGRLASAHPMPAR